MKGNITRREFLKLSALALGVGGLDPALFRVGLPFDGHLFSAAIGRVASPAIYIYGSPSFKGDRVGMKHLDTLVIILEEVQSTAGPGHNPLWYRLLDGYAHSGRIQRIELNPTNEPLDSIPAAGLYGEITVPYVRSFRFTRGSGWQPLYRLYYQSVHWVRDIDEGPDGAPWYRLQDTLLGVQYHIPASTVRKIDFRDHSPIARDIPSEEKRIVISISDQTLTAFEGDHKVLLTTISSGIHSETVDEAICLRIHQPGTPHPVQDTSRHMGDGNLTDDIEVMSCQACPGRWCSTRQVLPARHLLAQQLRTRMSHGCVNLRNADAKWLFRWTEPAFYLKDWYVMG
jgi:hypothetical protein